MVESNSQPLPTARPDAAQSQAQETIQTLRNAEMRAQGQRLNSFKEFITTRLLLSSLSTLLLKTGLQKIPVLTFTTDRITS